MGFSDKFKDAVKGVEAAEPAAKETKQFDVMAFLKQKLAEKGAEPVADEALNPDLVAEGPNFLEQAKTAIGSFGKSVDDLVERTPALKATKDFVADGWNKLTGMFSPEAAASGAVAGASADSLKQLFGKAEGHVNTMDYRPYEIDPDKVLLPDEKKLPDWLKPDGKKPGIQFPGPGVIGPDEPIVQEPEPDGIDREALDKVVSGLTEEEKAVMTEFQTAMGNKMLDVIEMGANYGISGESVQDSLEDMCQNYMSQMTPEQMATMIGVIQKCGGAGLITKDSTMEDVSKVLGEVIQEGADDEKVAESLKERVAQVSIVVKEKGFDVDALYPDVAGIIMAGEIPDLKPEVEKPDEPEQDGPSGDEKPQGAYPWSDPDDKAPNPNAPDTAIKAWEEREQKRREAWEAEHGPYEPEAEESKTEETKLRAEMAEAAFGVIGGTEALQAELE